MRNSFTFALGKKYYEKKEKTLLADLADIDSRMAELDQTLNPPGEGDGLSADVVLEESLDPEVVFSSRVPQ